MTMRLPKFTGQNFISSIPTIFWVILFVALISGLVFAGATKLITDQVGKNVSTVDVDFPNYVAGIKSSSKDEQLNLRKSLLGSWVSEKNTTRMILEFDPKGNFILRVNDKETPFYILVAHGRYSSTPTKSGKAFVLSERRNSPMPLRKPAPYYKFRNLDVLETGFIWTKQGNNLILSLSETLKAQENFEALFGDFANTEGEVTFEKVGRR